jgi:hypothetical protein
VFPTAAANRRCRDQPRGEKAEKETFYRIHVPEARPDQDPHVIHPFQRSTTVAERVDPITQALCRYLIPNSAIARKRRNVVFCFVLFFDVDGDVEGKHGRPFRLKVG